MKLITLHITVNDDVADDVVFDIREELGAMEGVEHVRHSISGDDPLDNPDHEYGFIWDRPCPYTLAHTRHWCRYGTCRDA